MKRTIKGIFIPISIFDSADLTAVEKLAIMHIDSVTTDPSGVCITPQILATALNVTQKESKEVLTSLFKKGAIETAIDEDGQTRIRALLYKESYHDDKDVTQPIEEKAPKVTYDFDSIAAEWNKLLPDLPKLTRWTPKRRKALRNCLHDTGSSVDTLFKAFKIIASVEFLNGKGDSFKCNPDWVFKTSNFEKIIDGYYSRSYKEKCDYQDIIGGCDVPNNETDAGYK
jgi:hypothetical protein